MKFKLFFAWFDFWIGLYYDVGHKTLYFNPFPCIVFRFKFPGEKKELKDRFNLFNSLHEKIDNYCITNSQYQINKSDSVEDLIKDFLVWSENH